jgi:hypothetical protein
MAEEKDDAIKALANTISESVDKISESLKGRAFHKVIERLAKLKEHVTNEEAEGLILSGIGDALDEAAREWRQTLTDEYGIEPPADTPRAAGVSFGSSALIDMAKIADEEATAREVDPEQWAEVKSDLINQTESKIRERLDGKIEGRKIDDELLAEVEVELRDIIGDLIDEAFE